MEGLIWFGKIKENWICKQTQPILIMSFLKHKWINWSTIWFEPCHRTQMVYTFRTIMLIIVIMIIIIMIVIIVVIIMTNMIIMILFPTKACGALVTQTTLLPAASSLERRFPIVAIYFSHWRHILLSFPIIGIYLSHCCNILFPLTSYKFPIVVIYFSYCCNILDVTNLVAGIITPNVIQDCLKLDTICLPNPPRGEVCFYRKCQNNTICLSHPPSIGAGLVGIGQHKRVS